MSIIWIQNILFNYKLSFNLILTCAHKIVSKDILPPQKIGCHISTTPQGTRQQGRSAGTNDASLTGWEGAQPQADLGILNIMAWQNNKQQNKTKLRSFSIQIAQAFITDIQDLLLKDVVYIDIHGTRGGGEFIVNTLSVNFKT